MQSGKDTLPTGTTPVAPDSQSMQRAARLVVSNTAKASNPKPPEKENLWKELLIKDDPDNPPPFDQEKQKLLHDAERGINTYVDQGPALCRAMYAIVKDKLYLHNTNAGTGGQCYKTLQQYALDRWDDIRGTWVRNVARAFSLDIAPVSAMVEESFAVTF